MLWLRHVQIVVCVNNIHKIGFVQITEYRLIPYKKETCTKPWLKQHRLLTEERQIISNTEIINVVLKLDKKSCFFCFYCSSQLESNVNVLTLTPTLTNYIQKLKLTQHTRYKTMNNTEWCIAHKHSSTLCMHCNEYTTTRLLKNRQALIILLKTVFKTCVLKSSMCWVFHRQKCKNY